MQRPPRFRRLAHGSILAVVGLLVGLVGLPAVSATETPSSSTATPTPTLSSVRVLRNVAYGSYGGRPLLLDAYLPAAKASARPAVLLIHGGGWARGDKAEERPVGEALARSGYVAFSINYTLASPFQVGYPLQIQQCQAALRWMEQNASQYGVDIRRIAVYGGSAGGYLAAMVATLPQPDVQPVRAAVSLSGPLDLTALIALVRAGAPCAVTGCAVTAAAEFHLDQYLGCSLLSCSPALIRAASPIDHVSPRSPPFFLYNSADEVIPVGQAGNMADRLRASHVPVQLMVLPGHHHGPPNLGLVAKPIAAFLAEYMRPLPPAVASGGTPSPAIRVRSVPSAAVSGGTPWWAVGVSVGGLSVVVVMVVVIFGLTRRARRHG